MPHHHRHDNLPASASQRQAGEINSTLSFDEKMIKLLEHWIKHNEDHARTYRDWAQKAKEKNKEKAAQLLEDAADMTLVIGRKFESAVKLLDKAE
jgi:hypothetical protein